MRLLRRLTLALALAAGAGVLLAPAISAQGKRDNDDTTGTRSVTGVVRDDAEAAVSGAVVKIKDTKTLQVRSFIAQGNGEYRFNGLNPNIDYELTADFQGKSSDTKTLSAFDTRKQAVVNLVIKK